MAEQFTAERDLPLAGAYGGSGLARLVVARPATRLSLRAGEDAIPGLNGMLELDLLLAPFAQEVFETLTYEDQLLYSDLLEQEDQDLFSWLLGRQVPADERFGPIIAKILAHKQKPA